MAEPLHRTQVLLRKDQHKALAERAERQGVSVSELIRTLVDEKLRRENAERRARIERRLANLEGIRQHHAEILRERGGKPIEVDPTELIREIREERDEELFGHLETGGA
ncbi:MAG TPA: ribbon-helix-helix protein, CopG family [Thermoanaerobaculia bacterium]|nr:ribbon-helix-helix protein, CopG family [Thermoanaerobaculia bacterium]